MVNFQHPWDLCWKKNLRPRNFPSKISWGHDRHPADSGWPLSWWQGKTPLGGWSVGRLGWNSSVFDSRKWAAPKKVVGFHVTAFYVGVEFVSRYFWCFPPKSGVPNSWSGIVYYGSAFPGYMSFIFVGNHFLARNKMTGVRQHWPYTSICLYLVWKRSLALQTAPSKSNLDILFVL